MTIKIDIPDPIITTLFLNGYSKVQSANIFKTYLTRVMSDMYGQFEENFEIWLDELDEEELNQIKNGKQL